MFGLDLGVIMFGACDVNADENSGIVDEAKGTARG